MPRHNTTDDPEGSVSLNWTLAVLDLV